MKAVLRHPTAPPVVVAVVADAASRTKGLRNHYYLPWSSGMLFVFPESGVHRFTMEETPLPLDMLFLDGEGMVVGIIPSAPPYQVGPFAIGLRSKYVLEVNSGWAHAYGVEPGDIFTYTPINGPVRPHP